MGVADRVGCEPTVTSLSPPLSSRRGGKLSLDFVDGNANYPAKRLQNLTICPEAGRVRENSLIAR